MGELLGDLERLVADLFPWRWPIMAGFIIVLGAVGVFGYRRRWHSWVLRHRVPVAIFGTPLVVVMAVAGYYLGSPLFTDVVVDEPLPFEFTSVVATDVGDGETGTTGAATEAVNPIPTQSAGGNEAGETTPVTSRPTSGASNAPALTQTQASPSPTMTQTPTRTPLPTATVSPDRTAESTPTSRPRDTATPSPTSSLLPTATAPPTTSPTAGSSPPAVATRASDGASTPTAGPATVPTSAPATATSSPVPTVTATPTQLPTATPTPSPSATPTPSPTATPPAPTATPPAPTATPTPQQSSTAAAAGPVKLKVGEFKDQDAFHKGSGTATIYRGPDGSHLLRLDNLDVTNGPDLHVILSPHADPNNRSDVMAIGYVDVGKLKGNKGNQNYPIPAGVDVAVQNSVVIYCVPFHVVFSVASLSDGS